MTRRFFRGFRYGLLGVHFVFVQHPRLLRYSVVPMLLTAFALSTALWGAWVYAPVLAEIFWSAPTNPGLLGMAARALHGLLSLLLTVSIAVVAVWFSVMLSTVVAAPFNDALSQRVELLVRAGVVPSGDWRSLMRDLKRTLELSVVKLLTLVAVMGPLMLLSLLLPGPGQVLSSIIYLLISIIYIATDFTDWPASRRDYSLVSRLRLWRRWPLELLGFGVGVWLLLWVPALNLCFMPAAVAGGTLLFLDVFEENMKLKE